MANTQSPSSTQTGPVLILLFSATLWGLSWWPVKQLVAIGLTGPLLPMLAYGVVGLSTSWMLWQERHQWRRQTGLLLGLALVGGWANTAFVSALMVGDVVRVMFLFYLSPVWSVLGGRLFLGERIPPWRAVAVAVAVVGLWLVITGGAAPQNVSFTLADVLALTAGLGFAGNNIIARAAQDIPLRSKTVSVFLGCGLLSGLAVLWQGEPVPSLPAIAWIGVLLYGFNWLLVATATWQYGVTHIESGRAGVILLAELLVAVVSASWWGGEQLSAIEWIGGALIAGAALIEALDFGHPLAISSTNKESL
ncbi:MAG: drug/metabolite transporter (DMT)-like permease [Rhodoferax sp.]|jgi:drug/metabolite transporter (DMT)-like permease